MSAHYPFVLKTLLEEAITNGTLPELDEAMTNVLIDLRMKRSAQIPSAAEPRATNEIISKPIEIAKPEKPAEAAEVTVHILQSLTLRKTNPNLNMDKGYRITLAKKDRTYYLILQWGRWPNVGKGKCFKQVVFNDAGSAQDEFRTVRNKQIREGYEVVETSHR